MLRRLQGLLLEGKCQGLGTGTRQQALIASDPKLPGAQTKLFLKQSGEVRLGFLSEPQDRLGRGVRCLAGRGPWSRSMGREGQVAVG